MDTTQFWSYYCRLVAKLLRPIEPGDGCSEQEIAEAEQRLGISLPQVLREYYLLGGQRADINQSFERLIPLSALYIKEDVLVFFEENQGVCLWGAVAMADGTSHDDPPALRADDVEDEEFVWEEHQGSLSSFFVEMLFIQCTNGAMEYTAVGDADRAKLISPEANWEQIDTGGESELQWLMRDGQLVFCGSRSDLADSSLRLSVFAGARTQDDLEATEQSINATWSDVFEAEE